MPNSIAAYHAAKLQPVAADSLAAMLLPGELADTIASLGYDWVAQMQQDLNNISINDLIGALKRCEVCSRAGKILSLRARAAFGEYLHPDKQPYRLALGGNNVQTVQEWVRSNFETMQGDLTEKLGMLFEQAAHFGHGVAEIVSTRHAPGYPFQERLHKLKVLEIDRYCFAGRAGEIDRIIYHPVDGSPHPIPLQKLLVIYNPRADNPEDLYGDPALARAYPFYLLRRQLWNMVGVAGSGNSIGRAVYTVPSEKRVQLFDRRGAQVFNADGSPKMVSAGYAVAEAVKRAKAGDPLVLDDDVKVTPLTVTGGEGFFNTMIPAIGKQIWVSYGIPSTIMDDTNQGLGNASLNQGHREVLDSQILGMLIGARSQTIEKIIRPLIVVNYGGKIDEFGEFGESKFLDPNLRSMRVSNLMQGLMQGLAATDDLDVVNVYREDVGLPPISSQDWELQQYQRLLAAQQAQEQTNG